MSTFSQFVLKRDVLDPFNALQHSALQTITLSSQECVEKTALFMFKLCLNSRDELIIIDLEKIAYFQANGNYTSFSYIKGEGHLLMIGLSKVEEYIRLTWPGNVPSPFVRMGRSLIINRKYLTEISVLKQKLTLSDCEGNSHSLTVPKPILKEYKAKINELYLQRNLKKACQEK